MNTPELLNGIIINGENGKEKTIDFTYQGKTNIKQRDYFNAMFNNDLTVKLDYNEFYYGGAFRCGKSASQQLAVFLLASKYPLLKVLYVRDTYDELKVSVIKQFNDEFEYLGNYTYLKSERTATFPNGSVIYFRAFNYDTDILSAEYDVICSCQVEDLSEELFLQFFGRLSGKILPSPLLLTEGNPAANYVKKRYKDTPKQELSKNRIFAITDGKTSDNPFVMPGYIERIRANYPDFWCARYLDANWDKLSDMVFSEFREDYLVNPVSFESIKHFKVKGGLDYGWVNPTALVWGVVDYDGNIKIFDEWGGTHKTALDIRLGAARYGRLPIVADYSIKSPDRDGKSLWQDLTRQEGLLLEESNKNELSNIVLVNSLFKTHRLTITNNCVELIKEIRNYKWKKLKLGQEKNQAEQTVDKDNHYIDALLYLLASLEEIKVADPAKEERKKTFAYINAYGYKDITKIKNSLS